MIDSMNQLKCTLRAFTVALLATVSVLAVRHFIFVPLLKITAPVMPFLLAVLAAAWISGTRAGLFATMFGAALGIYLRGGEIPSTDSQLRFALFVAIGVVISWTLGSLRSARQRTWEREQQLEQEVMDRRKSDAIVREQRDQLANEVRRREAAELELRDREERIRLAVESADIGTFDFHPITGERKWSDRAKVMFGLSPDTDVTNVYFLERVHPEDRERAQQAVQKALDPTGDGRYDIELRLVLPDGRTHWFIVKGQAFFDGEMSSRRATRFIGTVVEITERKQAEQVIRASESRLQAIMDNTSAVIYLKDLQGRYLMTNRRHEELFHITQQQIVGKTDADVFPSDTVTRLQANDRQVLNTGRPLEFEEVVPHSDGPHTYVSVKFPIIDPAGRITAVGGISTDISDRTRATDALKAEQEVLRHTIELQDQQRQLVAYEIHDGLVQYATGALMELESIQEQAKSESIAERIENVVGILRKTVEEGRRIIGEIHATVLDDHGVIAAVQQLIEDEERAHIQVEFVKDEQCGRMARKTEEALYRITQEALTNFYKHSKGNKVRIELGRCGDRVHLEVRDWGVGFTPSTNTQGIHGLRGMAERAKIAGGQCTIESANGGGTRVVVDLPYLARAE